MAATLPSSCFTPRTNHARCVRVPACGRESVQSYMESLKKTSPPTAERAAQTNSSGGPASLLADSSSRRAITLYPSSAASYEANVKDYSAINRDRIVRDIESGKTSC